MKTILSLILLCSLTFGATGKKGGVFSAGSSQVTCGQVVSNYGIDEMTNDMYKTWVAAFIIGSNYATSRVLSSNFDRDSLMLWVLNYCRENPLTPFIYATIELDKELDKKYTVK